MRPDMYDWTPVDPPGKNPPFVPMFDLLLRHMEHQVASLRAAADASFALRNGPVSSNTMDAKVLSTVGNIVDMDS